MSRTPFTLRIDSRERAALESLSKIERRPINQLLNHAIKTYLRQKGQAEQVLEENLSALKAYRKRDPGFRRAISAFVDAESSLKDSLEGEIIEDGIAGDSLKPAGSVQTKVRKVIGG